MRSFKVGCVVLAFTDDQKAQCELVCAHFQKELVKADALKEWNAFYAHKMCKVLEQQVLTPTERIIRRAIDTAEVPILRRILVMLQFVFHHPAVCEYLFLCASFTACSL